MHPPPESPAAAKLRRIWIMVVAFGVMTLAVQVFADLRAPAGVRPRWLGPAGILLLGLSGLVGRERRVLHATLLAGSMALLLASLFLALRGGPG